MDLIFEKFFTHPTKLTAFCRPYALIAVVAEPTHDVQVFRINGQLAYTIRRRSAEVEVTAVEFKPDGSVLGIGHSDGVCTLHSGENGKFTGQVTVRKPAAKDDWKLDLTPDYGIEDDETVIAAVKSIHWCKHTPPTPHTPHLQTFPTSNTPHGPSKYVLTTEQWGDDATDDKDIHGFDHAGTERLANELVKLDVTKVLPKMSLIPGSHGARHGAESGLFSNQTNLDNLIGSTTQSHPGKSTEMVAEVDVLLISSDQGDTVVLMDDTVRIGETMLDQDVVLRSSQPGASHHVHLCRSSDHYNLQFLDLPIASLGGPLLSLISTNTKRIQSLVTYVVHTVRCMEHDWTTGLAFPKRLIKNISEELTEKEEGDLVTNLCHLAMTGVFNEVMEEWLTDILKETNHKRWETAVSNMYTHIQDHIFYNLLPALDRLAIAATTLRGHAAFDESSDGFDVSSQLFTNILEGVDSLRHIAQKAQLRIMTEHGQFACFSRWLRMMIDVGMAKGTKATVEIEEREAPNIDYGLVLAYLKDTLTGTRMEWIVGPIQSNPDCSRDEFFAHPTMRRTYTTTIDALASLEKGELTEKTRFLVNLSSAAVFLSGQARDACDSITSWQSRLIPQSHVTVSAHIGRHEGLYVHDMKLLNSAAEPSSTRTIEVLTTEDQDDGSTRLCMYSINRPHLATEPSSLSVEQPWAIDSFSGLSTVDVKFFRERCMIMLLQGVSGEYLVAMRDLRKGEETNIMYRYPQNSAFKPQRIVLGGTLCVLIGHAGRQWQVLEIRERY